ncbi:DUF1499 domain-containing protein [Prochlorococcus marinus]|uniref:DUF1499 domain-containing protein n=1 Tax=Prochlorococcus marinus TaxID=1219 RepID=UPI0022B331FC|nr:DUF1499 domain-containing protein [Prochlorococcus marinus]
MIPEKHKNEFKPFAVLTKQILYILLILCIAAESANAAITNNQSDNYLPECIVVTHCVRENWEVNNVEDVFEKTALELSHTPRTKIVKKTNSLIEAEAKTRWRRYTDDLLIKAIPSENMIQVRSESRVGIGDNGVNKKRIDQLAKKLEIK